MVGQNREPGLGRKLGCAQGTCVLGRYRKSNLVGSELPAVDILTLIRKRQQGCGLWLRVL